MKTSSKPRFVQHPEKPKDYYIVIDGVKDMLEVYHTDVLLLGDNNGDYTISFHFLQTVETEEFEYHARNIIHKGKYWMYRSTTI